MNKTIAVIGATGLVGGYLARAFAKDNQHKKIIPTTHSITQEGFEPLDITD